MAGNNKHLMITLDLESGMPLWVQLRNRLVYLIESGVLASGDKLPTVREMAVDLGINYNTVSKVYQDIEKDGYIVSRRGKGTFVAHQNISGSYSLKTEADVLTDDFIHRCLDLGLSKEEVVSLVERRIGHLDV